MEEILRKEKRLLWSAPAPIRIPGFTAIELSAAEQLVQLSESSPDTSAATLQRSFSSALSSSSSPISVGSIAPPPYRRHPLSLSVAKEAEDEDDDDGGFKRLRPRYRSIADIYADCVRIDEVAGDGRKRPRREG
ncbi:uncharacterized protein LOC110095034 [Dendrobium catenatum]|uniref:Uncharacterized protein n=1 Tax=Dendrobium catenatum TaxID=906689 RepID=A0A2I0VM82_9ASPA|nr:uncharacterized protein LOC110095034 [Dendrobium catenatum]PKU64524.1 hypothetical protein MA16_Dca008447 [Dendrobium catenatum]